MGLGFSEKVRVVGWMRGTLYHECRRTNGEIVLVSFLPPGGRYKTTKEARELVGKIVECLLFPCTYTAILVTEPKEKQ
jgi:hypothetical protein